MALNAEGPLIQWATVLPCLIDTGTTVTRTIWKNPVLYPEHTVRTKNGYLYRIARTQDLGLGTWDLGLRTQDLHRYRMNTVLVNFVPKKKIYTGITA